MNNKLEIRYRKTTLNAHGKETYTYVFMGEHSSIRISEHFGSLGRVTVNGLRSTLNPEQMLLAIQDLVATNKGYYSIECEKRLKRMYRCRKSDSCINCRLSLNCRIKREYEYFLQTAKICNMYGNSHMVEST